MSVSATQGGHKKSETQVYTSAEKKQMHCAVPQIYADVLSTCFPANTEAVLNNRLCAVFRTPYYNITIKMHFT